jgi:hypothetical protein
MATKKKLLQAAAGSAGSEPGLNVEEVFSTYLYEGNSSTQTITNGIDLDGEGGLVWCKRRDASSSHALYDTERGASGTDALISNTTDAEVTGSMSSFNNNGFTLDSNSRSNASGDDMASWTFRKAPKFFDVVTYTGTGSPQSISHNLGTTVGTLIVKRTDSTGDWLVQHRSLGGTYYMDLQNTNQAATNTTYWNNTTATSTEFTVGTSPYTNASGGTYVAYLFAHNDGDGEFGGEADADIIKCGSYSGDGTTNGTNEVTLGWEPQWILTKRSDSADNWHICDVMRGQTTDGITQRLRANTSAAESSNYGAVPTPTGFKLYSDNSSGGTYIYIAIRRGPMAVPESATDVFAIDTGANSTPSFDAGFTIDASLVGRVDSTDKWYFTPRLTGSNYLNTATTAAESSSPAFGGWDYQTQYYGGNLPSNYQAWMWKRAPSFCDVVAYTGNSTAGRTVSHNLGVAPEMMWVKRRDTSAADWAVYHSALGNTKQLVLNSAVAEGTVAYWNNTTPTETNFTLGAAARVNNSGSNFIAYLFASLDGVSKVGSYTGNGTSQTIDCGFTSGARFVLIKRTDSANNWFVWDTERGIVAGNDARLALNLTVAEYSGLDEIDPDSSGFIVNQTGGNNNVSGAEYIFYAIA